MEQVWIERAQSAEAKLATMQSNMGAAIERVQVFKANFGIKERSNGEIDIDFDKFVENLGEDNALELKRIIETKYTTLHLKHG